MLENVTHPSTAREFIIIHREGIPKIYSAATVGILFLCGVLVLVYRQRTKLLQKKSDDHRHRTLC